jgi:hypothetical protein
MLEEVFLKQGNDMLDRKTAMFGLLSENNPFLS